MDRAVLQGPFTVDDYYRMAEVGILGEDDRVELIEGQVVQMTPIGSRHSGYVNRLNRLLVGECGDRAVVAVQNPVRLDRRSEPQPDLSVLRPRADDYTGSHPGPGDVFLLIEVGETSLDYDRGTKLPLYARHAIPEVWIVDLQGDRIEIHREPYAGSYARSDVVDRGGRLEIAALPGAVMEADEILR